MAVPTSYVYTKSISDTNLLQETIQSSSIVTAIDHIDTVDSTITIWFKDALSTQDHSTLDSIVAAYQDPSPSIPLNSPVPVVTQYEYNDKDLKLAKGTADVDETGKAVISVKVPGTFGSSDGRYVAGGYAICEDYNKDDYVTVRILDNDRAIAMALALSQDPNATEPLSDAAVQGLGDIPGFGAFPLYPVVKSYTDDELDPANQGWYFWPLIVNGSTAGECEVEPIGGYGFLPAGMYIVITYQRPNGVTTGSCKVNFYWGKKE